MITVRLYVDPDGDLIGFWLDGHALTADHGNDLVCAAASALAQSAVMGLENIVQLEGRYQVDAGVLWYRLPDCLDDDKLLMSRAIVGTMMTGLRAIAAQYPQAMRIRRRRCRRCL